MLSSRSTARASSLGMSRFGVGGVSTSWTRGISRCMPPNSGADQRPFDVGGERADPAEMPAVRAAIDRRPRSRRIRRCDRRRRGQRRSGSAPGPMRVSRRRSQRALAKARCVSWPSTRRIDRLLACSSTLPPRIGVVEPEPGVDRRQRDRDALLDVVDAQALERPAGDARDRLSGLIRSALTKLRSRSSRVMSYWRVTVLSVATRSEPVRLQSGSSWDLAIAFEIGAESLRSSSASVSVRSASSTLP